MSSQAPLLQYDLTPKIGSFIDIHLLLKVLSFYEENKFYPEEDLLKAKLTILSKTNMVRYAIEIYRQLHKTQDDPPGMPSSLVDKHLQTLKELKENKFLSLFEGSADVPKNLLASDQWNLAHLAEHHQTTQEDVEKLHTLAKFYYEIGSYVEASDLLRFYCPLVSDPQKRVEATWGKLGAEILVSNWGEAAKDMSTLQDLIEEPSFQPEKQLQQKTWLSNWALFVHFQYWKNGGLATLLDTLCSERYLHAIQSNAPYILRYLTIAAIMSKSHLKEIVKVVEEEIQNYSDPIVEFIRALYIKYDFEEAEKQLSLCGPILVYDYIVSGTEEVEGLKNEFLVAGRYSICEAYCKIHSTIDIAMMAQKLGKTNEESERWIVNLIRNSKLDAKIDSAKNQVIVQSQVPSVYQQLIEKTKPLMLRTNVLANQIERTKVQG